MMPGMNAPDDSSENTEPTYSDRPDRGETYGQWTSRLAEEKSEAKAHRQQRRTEDRKEATGKVAAVHVYGNVVTVDLGAA